ncbi:hypothetical protein UFOVP1475_31 [uncultured Caudovirales phage]|uniref:Uncharacterized protein n=1 Tax=uncultured Caudovirales phage TaxID=2100421 RepID=A0A6J5SL09_9CAUD|nr:hypothetical protein UFOVP1475_31 [uncultured Caudovirales phage]
MGSLSNQYISQSFVSLIHLGSDTTITSSFTTLQDGLGNSLGVSVNALGEISASGNIYGANITGSSSLISSASIALYTASFNNGTRNLTFTKGDNQTFSVNIPDVSGSTDYVTTASFNSYTASTNNRLNNIESTTASLNTSVSNLNTFSASALTSISNLNTATASLNSSISQLNASSASQQVSIDNLNTNSASVNTSISALNTFTASQSTASIVTSINNLNTFSASTLTRLTNIESTTASLNTSASLALVTASFDNGTRNLTFTKGNTSTFSVNIPDTSGSATTTIYDTVYTGESITKGDPLYISGAQGANPIVYKADASNPAKMPVTYVSNETIGAGTTTEAIILGHIEGVNLTGYTAGQTIYVAEGGGWSASLPSGSNSVTQLLGVITKGGSGGKGLVLNPGPAQLPGLDTGKMWVGNGTNQPIEITTASFASSASFNSYTSSTNIRLNNLEAATSSYAISSSVAAVDFAQQQQINSLIAFTSSVTSSTTIQSSGTTLGQATTLNFLGTGVNVSVGAGTASITINAGSGSSGTSGNSYTSTFTGTTWVVNHNLNTSVPLVFAYESGSQWVIPASLDVTSPNSVTLQFSALVSGSVVVVNGGDQTVISSFTNATTAVVAHNLNTDWPMVQVYESGSKAQIIPLSVVSDTANQITVGFSTATSGQIVIKK